jgi:IS4 transposase
MARLLLQRAVRPDLIDEIFEAHRWRQYHRELLFSTVVEIMTLVSVGLRPSVHAAARSLGDFGASLQALYEKLRGTSPGLVRALVRATGQELLGVRRALGERRPPVVTGLRVLVFDGNHLPASEKRLGALRGFRGAALPGHALVVYEPDTDLVVDVLAAEDAHASELSLVPALLPTMGPGDLYLADRLFGNRPLLVAIAGRGAYFNVRIRADKVRMTLRGPRRRVAQTARGVVYEQRAVLEDDRGQRLRVRRIEVHLAQPTEDGERVIVLLSNVPARTLSAVRLADLYLARWTIETMFQRLEAALHSEVRSLGHPRAALLAFGTAVVAYNILATLQHAIAVEHRDTPDLQLSTYHLAVEVRATYQGMMLAVGARVWATYDTPSPRQLARLLRHVARHVPVAAFRKSPRGPKPATRPGYVAFAVASQHVSTARILNGTKSWRRP